MKRVFFLTSGRLTLYRWQGASMLDPIAFEADEEGLSRFATYLSNDSSTPAMMLVDLVEEEFREDTIPHVIGGDRKAILRTKQNRLFRDPQFTHALSQGRETGGRRDDRMLFSALIRPDLLAPWLAQLARHKVPLKGIYSLAILSQDLLKKLSISAGQALLVSLQSSGGLRQTFFRDGRMKISRLAAMPGLEKSQYASYMLAEVEKTRRYLNSLRLVSNDAPLEVYILSQGRLGSDLKQQASNSITTRYHIADMDETAKAVGLKGTMASPYADALLSEFLVRRPPSNHYARNEDRQYFGLYRTRLGLVAVGLLLLLGSLTWSGFRFFEGALAKQQTVAVSRQTSFYSGRYNLAKETLPPAPAEAMDLQKAVNSVAALGRFKSTPWDLMVAVSRGLEDFPTLKLASVDWRSSMDPNAAVGREQPRTQPAASNNPQFNPDGSPIVPMLYQLARLKGEIDPFDGNYRLALQQVRAFAATLKKLNGMRSVRILSLPLDISSQERLTGSASADVGASAAEFEIKIVLEVGTYGGA